MQISFIFFAKRHRIVAGRGEFFKFFAGNKKAPLRKGGRMPFVRPPLGGGGSPSGTSCYLPRAVGVCLAEGGDKGCAYSPIEAGWSVGVCSFWYFREAAMKPLNSG